ncbi:hypothetical protein FRB94_003485 [Tulasnella sp. JGI-2019a]|nr:hypothetical protein FRB93_013993 [Tulasnella sp. JGI-2019a]KAG9002909.1 hypothetical protein FRB94_003485 [Tulasnella sp. JGI-2019a]
MRFSTIVIFAVAAMVQTVISAPAPMPTEPTEDGFRDSGAQYWKRDAPTTTAPAQDWRAGQAWKRQATTTTAPVQDRFGGPAFWKN